VPYIYDKNLANIYQYISVSLAIMWEPVATTEAFDYRDFRINNPGLRVNRFCHDFS